MKKNLKSATLLAAAVVMVSGSTTVVFADGSCSAHAAKTASHESASTLHDAFAQAEKSELPVLIKVGTEWCGPCKAFDKATASNESIQSSLEKNVVLYRVDAEKGKGVDIAKHYKVSNYPTFILANADGEVLDRWMGFEDSDKFNETLSMACTDPLTIDDRAERFRANPTEKDAAKLAGLSMAQGLFAEANAYFQRASQINPNSEVNYDLKAFQAVSYGAWKGPYSTADAQKAADAVFASNKSQGMDYISTAHMMAKVAHGNTETYLPYLQAAVEKTANDTDEKVQAKRAHLMPDYALHVEKNVNKAVSLKKETMKTGWDENANMLNNFAWWCFENQVNLDEAEQLARKGVELAESGTEKANILDTLAEICNIKGDCGDALNLINLAIAEDPSNSYFADQKVRFEELLAQQN